VSFLNRVLDFCKVIASAVGGTSTTTLYNLTGIGGFALDEDGQATGADETDEGSEQAHEQECFSGLGLIGRPLPPEGALFCEAVCARTEDGLVPFAFRDLRLHRCINPSGAPVSPAEGQLMVVGYGGGFLSLAMTAANTGSKRGNVLTLYVPHSFDAAGVPAKAHAITIDPSSGNSSISIVHASGAVVTLGEQSINLAVDGATFAAMRPGEFMVNAAKITLKGNVYLGASAETGLPLLPGIASPPSPSVFVSPV
jgi:hypothetical protein